MKLQGSGPSDPKILQYQIGQSSKNRLTLNQLVVIHGRLANALFCVVEWSNALLSRSLSVSISVSSDTLHLS
jgi:hypothetical protein